MRYTTCCGSTPAPTRRQLPLRRVEFVPFLVCTTNAIESVNACIRRAVKARGHFPNEAAALKCES
jgi:transposase-like protein